MKKTVKNRIFKRRTGFLAQVMALAALSVLFAAAAGPVSASAGSEAPRVKEVSGFEAFSREVSAICRQYNIRSAASEKAPSEFDTCRLIAKGRDVDLTGLSPVAAVRDGEGYYVLQFETAGEARDAYRKIRASGTASWVEPDRICRLSGTSVSAAPRGSVASFNSWGASKIGVGRFAGLLKGVPRKVTVAVVDSGVSSHPFLKGRVLSGGHDYVDGDSSPTDVSGGTGHGTHVAGIIVDCTPGLNVKILPVRVADKAGDCDMLNVGMGIRYAACHGAKIINLSLCGGQLRYVDEAVSYAVSKGATVVAAAGNNAGSTANYCPAHLSNAIVVSALSESLGRTWYSNYGSSVDVAAPGDAILSCAPGGGFVYMDGTSMAAPHVSAVAAMLKLAHPSATPARIQSLIVSRAKDIGAAGKDKYFGYGMVYAGSYGLVKPSGVTLLPKAVTIKLGNGRTLTATVSPYDAADKSLTWTSSNRDVARVSSTGRVSSRAAGKTTITVKTVNGKTAKCEVTVVK